MGFVIEGTDDCAVYGIDCGSLTLENDSGAGLCEGSFAEHEEAAAGAIGGLTIAESGGEGNTTTMLDGFIGQIEDDA